MTESLVHSVIYRRQRGTSLNFASCYLEDTAVRTQGDLLGTFDVRVPRSHRAAWNSPDRRSEPVTLRRVEDLNRVWRASGATAFQLRRRDHGVTIEVTGDELNQRHNA